MSFVCPHCRNDFSGRPDNCPNCGESVLGVKLSCWDVYDDVYPKLFKEEKLDWSLLPLECLEEVVRAFEDGVSKYGRDNWKEHPDLENYCVSKILRHMRERQKRFRAPDSKIPHLAHLIADALFLLWKGLEDEKAEIEKGIFRTSIINALDERTQYEYLRRKFDRPEASRSDDEGNGED